MILLEKLTNAGQLLSQLHFQISSTSKSFIAPVKPIKELLHKTKPGALLFGDKLGEKIKTVKAMEKIGKEIKNASTTKTNQYSGRTSQNNSTKQTKTNRTSQIDKQIQ